MGTPLPNHQAITLAEAFVTHFVCTHGITQTIWTDQGTDFLRKIFIKAHKSLQINKINTSPFHSQTRFGKKIFFSLYFYGYRQN